MKQLYYLVKTNAFGFWIGASMSLVGFHFFSWEYWFVVAPTILLAHWKFD